MARLKQQHRSKWARRGRGANLPRRWSAVFIASVAFSLLIALSLYLLHKRIRLTPPGTYPRAVGFSRQSLLRLRDAVLRVGGIEVWVKGTSRGRFPPPDPESVVEVLAQPEVFSIIQRELVREGEKEGFEARLERESPVGNDRSVLVDFTSAGGLAGRWRLREVSEIRRAAIVIDDLGADLKAVQRLLALPYPLTYSVLPHLAYSRATAEMVYSAGEAVMLHLPMEPEALGLRAGPREIKVGMRSSEVAEILRSDLESVPFAGGVNNHMGSRATANPVLMAEVMRVLAGRRLYFVDSRTTGASVAYAAARRAGLPAFYRSVFLDDRQSVPYTLGQLRQFRRMIEQQGVALAIGHPHATTLAALADFLPKFAEDDIELVSAAQLVRLPEAARLYRAT